MASESESEQKIGESSSTFVDEAARKTDSAIRNTAQKYIGRRGTREVEITIRNKPLTVVASATVVGFVAGGGMASRPDWSFSPCLGAKPLGKRRPTLSPKWYGAECANRTPC
jgi:hypothetical protein